MQETSSFSFRMYLYLTGFLIDYFFSSNMQDWKYMGEKDNCSNIVHRLIFKLCAIYMAKCHLQF